MIASGNPTMAIVLQFFTICQRTFCLLLVGQITSENMEVMATLIQHIGVPEAKLTSMPLASGNAFLEFSLLSEKALVVILNACRTTIVTAHGKAATRHAKHSLTPMTLANTRNHLLVVLGTLRNMDFQDMAGQIIGATNLKLTMTSKLYLKMALPSSAAMTHQALRCTA